MPEGIERELIVVDDGSTDLSSKISRRMSNLHPEIVCVPENLCARIPDNVTDEQVTFTVLGAIGLQGIRLTNPTLDENFVVFGVRLGKDDCTDHYRRFKR